MPMENRLSRSPVIRESDMTTNTMPLFPLEGRIPTDRQPRISTLPYIRSESFEPNRMGEDYVDTTLAPQPTSNVVFVSDTTRAQGASETPSSPLDVTMLAMLGLTMAGAGVMKSQSAQKKQQELAQANAVAQAQLTTAKAEQAQIASANWEQNQTMQANAQQAVITEVTQSDANRQFWADYAIWEQKVAEAEAKRQAEQHQTATSGMFPPGSTVEDLPPHLQKLFWELGNMHFEKDENGDWRFADDRGELGYHQYLIRQALKNGDNTALMAHFQSANQWIDKSLINWVDKELQNVTQSALETTRRQQEDAVRSVSPDKFDGKYTNAPQKYLANVQNKLLNVTKKAIETTQIAVDNKSKELKTDLVRRDREHLVGHVDESAIQAMTTFTTGVLSHQQHLITQAKQVTNNITPLAPKNVSTNGDVRFNLEFHKLANETAGFTLQNEDNLYQYPPGVTSYDDICTIFQNSSIRDAGQVVASVCFIEDREGMLREFKDQLNLIQFGGVVAGFPISARFMQNYLNARGTNLYINGNYLYENMDEVDKNRLQYEFSLYYDKLFRSIEFRITNQTQIVSISDTVGFAYRFMTPDLVFSLASANFRPTSDTTVEYLFNPDTGILDITVKQNLEIVDRYDWIGEPILYHPERGFVRTLPLFYSNRVVPPLQINPLAYTVTVLSGENEIVDVNNFIQQAISEGYAYVPYPPDRADFGAFNDYLRSHDTLNQGDSFIVEKPVFTSTPNDHPNPLRRINPELENFSSGQFHLLESRGEAKPFFVFSNADVVVRLQLDTTKSEPRYEVISLEFNDPHQTSDSIIELPENSATNNPYTPIFDWMSYEDYPH